MTTIKKAKRVLSTLRLAALVLLVPTAFVACGDDEQDAAGGNAGTGGTSAGGSAAGGQADPTLCMAYCSQLEINCTGENAQYTDNDDCVSYCEEAQWPEGELGDVSGNTLQCRIYHGGDPAVAEPNEHCVHAGPTGHGVCGAALTFRSDAPGDYTRVDRMGMPAVSTALISSDKKNAYNDGNQASDAAGDFVPDLAANLTALHGALDDDLTGLNLTPCSMTTIVNGLPECFGQEVAPGVTVASLVLPDSLHIDPSAAAGFPNGRQLGDPVMDITLGVILLKLGGSCGTGTCGAATLVDPPLNPGKNDVPFESAFPYFAKPHQP